MNQEASRIDWWAAIKELLIPAVLLFVGWRVFGMRTLGFGLLALAEAVCLLCAVSIAIAKNRPSRHRITAGVAAIVSVAVIYPTIRQLWPREETPEDTIRALDQLKTVDEVNAASNYLTDDGKRVLIWTIQHENDDDTSQGTMGTKTVTGDKCSFQVSSTDQGVVTVSDLILIHKGKYWKFDDVWVESFDGKNVSMKESFIIDHPYQAALTMVWQNPDVVLAYAQKLIVYFTTGYKIAQVIGTIAAAF